DRLADAFAVPEFLVHGGAAESIDRVEFTLEDSSGQRAALRVGPVDASAPPHLIAYTAAANVPTTFARQDPALNYWFRYRPDSRTLFFRYNRCAEMDSLPFAAFARRMLDTLGARPVERVVVDLRANTGGNSRVIDPFLEPILDRRDLARKDRL